MPLGQYVFSQVMDHLPLTTFRRCVERYAGERKVKHFSCLDQFLCLAFAQLTWRESLRDIEACLAEALRSRRRMETAGSMFLISHRKSARPRYGGSV